MVQNNSDLPHNLVGFLNDPVSEQIVINVIKETGLAYSEATQGSLSKIIEFLKNNRTPKILIVDISNSELPLGDIAKIKELCTPNLNLIVVGTRNDVGLFRDLMNIGISDYLVKPLNNALIKRAIDKANGLKKGTDGKTGKMVQFISSVGGAGATTTASNIGWILANQHFKRSLVMDIDFLYGTANLMLDIKAENSYLDILESPEKIDDYFVETILRKHGNRLYYLGGLADLVRGVNVDIDAFDALVALIKRQFNYVLVDSQREVSPINKVCMDRADSFAIMVEMSVASAQNATRIIELLTTTQPGKKILVIANKVGLSSGGSLPKESFESVINRKIDYIMPLDESIALAAANIGQPVAASSSPITAVLESVTDDLIGKRESVHIEQAIIEKEGWTADRVKNEVVDLFKKLMILLKK